VTPDAGQSQADLIGSEPPPWLAPSDHGAVGADPPHDPGSTSHRTATPADARIQPFDCYPSGTVILTQLGVLRSLDAVQQQHASV